MGKASALARLGVLALLVTVAWWHDAPPAHACSCVGVTDRQAFEQSDAVFVGEFVAVEAVSGVEDLLDLPFDGSVSGGRYTFAVDQVFKGDVDARQAVVSGPGGGGCGLEVEPGTIYLVFATRESSGELSSGLCGGNREVAAEDAVPADFPAPQAATPVAAADIQEGRSPWVIAGLAALVLILAGAGVLAWRSGRSHSDESQATP